MLEILREQVRNRAYSVFSLCFMKMDKSILNVVVNGIQLSHESIAITYFVYF